MIAAPPAQAQQRRRGGGPPPGESGAPAATTQASADGQKAHPAEDKLVVTHHEVKLGDQTVKYEATAGTLAVKDEAGKPRANMFFVAYRKEGEDIDVSKRPITYLFNGGPGAAAVWLHLGAVGPRKIQLDDHGIPAGPPHSLIDNPNTWLDFTDLVFIDPVTTGYSRAAEGVKPEDFYGVENDLRSVAEFIRLYTTRYGRWPSPKFLAGESYGTTRAAALSEYLLDRVGIDLNGIVFISSVLDFGTLNAGGSNDLPYISYLPSYAAVAHHFKKLPDDLMADRAKTLAEVEKFADGEYAEALVKGDALKDDEKKAIADKLARYTGLPADEILRRRLRIDPGFFRKRLLRDQEKVLGRYDARIVGDDVNPASERESYDPSYSFYLPAYKANAQNYLRGTLKFETDLTYEVLTDRVRPWNMGEDGRGYLNVASQLAEAMHENPKMHVLFASGYEDLATPYFATNYTLDHMHLPADLRKNVDRQMYEGGHMLYHVKESLEKLHKDVGEFMKQAMQ
jgi:carboxypeptidase C (cathepsin A)